MKKLAALAALLTLASPAFGTPTKKALVIDNHYKITATLPLNSAIIQEGNRNQKLYYDILNMMGVQYKPVHGSRALWSNNSPIPQATGLMLWNTPSTAVGSGSFSEQFDCVINLGAQRHTGPSVRSDSTWLMQYGGYGGPLVNELVFLDDAAQLTATTLTQANADSTHGIQNALLSNGNAPATRSQEMYRVGTSGQGWTAFGAYMSGQVINSAAGSVNGGIRKLIAANAQVQNYQKFYAECDWCDSLLTPWQTSTVANTDTVSMWERLYIGGTGKRVTFAFVDGSGTQAADTLGLSWPAEFEPELVIMGICHLDSLMGNGLIDYDKMPMVRALTVDGLCSRGKRQAFGGINPSDTTTFYAVMDSLNLAGIPITWGVNADPDSMGAYKRDLIKAAQNPLARFTPEVRAGLDMTVAMNGGATKYHRVRDAWGRYRNRIAYGDGSGAGKDSSLWANLMWQKWVLDSALSTVGAPSRLSMTLIAPDDDWSPLNLINVNGTGGTITADSIMYAITKAGYSALRVDVQDPSATGGYPGNASSSYSYPADIPGLGRNIGHTIYTNPIGFNCRQQTVTSSINGQQVKMIGQTGFFLNGAQSQVDLLSSSPTVGIWTVLQNQYRVMSGFTCPWDGAGNQDGFVMDMTYGNNGIVAGSGALNRSIRLADFHTLPRKAYAMKLSCNDLSGVVNAGGGNPPARSGWWQVKSFNNAFKAMNYFTGGKTVMKWGYPEDVAVDQ